jgi:hypothetical protein
MCHFPGNAMGADESLGLFWATKYDDAVAVSICVSRPNQAAAMVRRATFKKRAKPIWQRFAGRATFEFTRLAAIIAAPDFYAAWRRCKRFAADFANAINSTRLWHVEPPIQVQCVSGRVAITPALF